MPCKSPVQLIWNELPLRTEHPTGCYGQEKYGYSHFRDEETEVQREEGSCLRSHSWIVDELGLGSKPVLFLSRLRVSFFQASIGIQPWNGCWGREGAEWTGETGIERKVCIRADTEGIHSLALLLLIPHLSLDSRPTWAFSKQAPPPSSLHAFVQDIFPVWQPRVSSSRGLRILLKDVKHLLAAAAASFRIQLIFCLLQETCPLHLAHYPHSTEPCGVMDFSNSILNYSWHICSSCSVNVYVVTITIAC